MLVFLLETLERKGLTQTFAILGLRTKLMQKNISH